MSIKLSALLNSVGLILVLVVNALANILPINGYNTGQVSSFYPNYFVPAGFTFGIWGIVYLLLIGFVVCNLVVAFSSAHAAVEKMIRQASPLFQLTCLLNAAWIVAWHYLFLGTSLLIMIAFLVLLVKLYVRIRPQKNNVPLFYRLWTYHAFVIYLAWISVATIANFTALFVGLGWQGGPLLPQIWAFVLVLTGLVLGIFFVGRLKEPAYGFVFAWAFYGIYANQMDASRLVGTAAACTVCLMLALTITILVGARKIAR